MITITLTSRRTLQQLQLLKLPTAKRKRLIWRAAQELKKVSARNIREQRDWNGTPWAPRKRGKRKMLLGLRKRLSIRWHGENVALHFNGGHYGAHPGVVAGTHQRGHTFRVTAIQRARISPNGADKSAPATRGQARYLRRLGFKRPGKRRGVYRAASIAWITANLNQAQAGLLIKKLSGTPSKQSWNITLPARPFLGASAKQREQAFARALQGINYGWDVNKHDMRK